jgi:hypothetical protein
MWHLTTRPTEAKRLRDQTPKGLRNQTLKGLREQTLKGLREQTLKGLRSQSPPCLDHCTRACGATQMKGRCLSRSDNIVSTSLVPRRVQVSGITHHLLARNFQGDLGLAEHLPLPETVEAQASASPAIEASHSLVRPRGACPPFSFYFFLLRKALTPLSVHVAQAPPPPSLFPLVCVCVGGGGTPTDIEPLCQAGEGRCGHAVSRGLQRQASC